MRNPPTSVIVILCLALGILGTVLGTPENLITIESGLVSCLRKQVTISFVVSLVSNPDWRDCHLWTILLHVNSTFHSKKILCGIDCQGLHETEPVENRLDSDSSFAKSCSYKAKLDLEQQTLLHLHLQSKNETNPSNNLFLQMRCTEKHKLEIDPASLNESRSPTMDWLVDPDRWITSYLSLYHSIVRSTMKLNLSPQPDGQTPQIAANQQTFDFPVFVMNLPHRSDRRRSTEDLLRTLGFEHVIFPNVTLASAIDPGALVQDHFVSPEAINSILSRSDKGPGALHAYLANALDQVGRTA
jgi:hypothetical protein